MSARFADVTKIGEVAVANTGGASLSSRVVVADLVIAVTVISVAGTANVAGFAGPTEITIAGSVTAALAVSSADIVGDTRAFEFTSRTSETVDAVAEDGFLTRRIHC